MKNANLTKYHNKEVSASKAITNFINPGDRIFIGSGCAEPLDLTEQLIELAPQIPDTQILHFLNLSDLDYYKKAGDQEDLFRHNAFFIGENLRDAINEGQADYTPMLLSEIPRLFKRGRIHMDTALIQVSPPDKNGFCSYGINVDIVKTIAEAADRVVAEVNPHMPRVYGDAYINMDNIDAFIKTDHEIVEFTYDEPDENDLKIAEYVASLIEDGSTIQMGIGKIPNAVTRELEDKKNLGVHSEVFSDGVVDLVEQGVINCSKKSYKKGKIVVSFVMGSKKLYQFVDNNPMVEFHPSDFVNDPMIISRNENQVAINAAISVDITGQVNADSIGHKFYSGIGGQIDFIRGSARAHNGTPIIVLPSTTNLPNGETVSRIVPYLQSGSGVVITRGDVHYVVTEWGIADLYGKSIRERALQMINIAHPDFREDLLKYAKKCNYVYSDQKLPKSVEGRVSIYPDKYETIYKVDDENILIRPVKPTDERKIQELYYSLDEQDRYYRFFTQIKQFPHKRIQNMITIDYSTSMILVGQTRDEEKKIIALSAFFKTKKPSEAEIAVVVHEDWRNQGIAHYLLNYLVQIGREMGYKVFSGTVLKQNQAMLHILKNMKYPFSVENIEGPTIEFLLDIRKETEKENERS